MKWPLASIKDEVKSGNFRLLARLLSFVENDTNSSEDLLEELSLTKNGRVIGITGPPGAGKSTLLNKLVSSLSETKQKIAVLAVDPTSPFNHGSLLGDRIRMPELERHSHIYIRSIATRGSLGGLSAKTIEMVDILKAMAFDYIFVETVGIGQSEIDIAALADITLLVLVPESGDEIQNLKSGVMEIADAFVINKYDREGSEFFTNNLKQVLHDLNLETPIFTSIATLSGNIEKLLTYIQSDRPEISSLKKDLLFEKAWLLIQHQKMARIDKEELRQKLAAALQKKGFNLYAFVAGYSSC